jgi:hypothetical protein
MLSDLLHSYDDAAGMRREHGVREQGNGFVRRRVPLVRGQVLDQPRAERLGEEVQQVAVAGLAGPARVTLEDRLQVEGVPCDLQVRAERTCVLSREISAGSTSRRCPASTAARAMARGPVFRIS